MKKTNGWILEANLYVFLKILADECEYAFDENDKDAFEAGIQPDSTFEYSFEGKAGKAIISIFFEGGTSVLEITIEIPDQLIDRIGMLYSISQEYYLKSSP